jgi:hypothetical protein
MTPGRYRFARSIPLFLSGRTSARCVPQIRVSRKSRRPSARAAREVFVWREPNPGSNAEGANKATGKSCRRRSEGRLGQARGARGILLRPRERLGTMPIRVDRVGLGMIWDCYLIRQVRKYFCNAPPVRSGTTGRDDSRDLRGYVGVGCGSTRMAQDAWLRENAVLGTSPIRPPATLDLVRLALRPPGVRALRRRLRRPRPRR